VSERTVFRHFPTRETLLDGLSHWFNERVGDFPHDISAEAIPTTIAQAFADFDEHEALTRAMLASPGGREFRRHARAARLAHLDNTRLSGEQTRPAGPDSRAPLRTHLGALRRRRCPASVGHPEPHPCAASAVDTPGAAQGVQQHESHTAALGSSFGAPSVADAAISETLRLPARTAGCASAAAAARGYRRVAAAGGRGRSLHPAPAPSPRRLPAADDPRRGRERERAIGP
jgi:hypothetical protein